MRVKLLHETEDHRTFAVVFEKGEEFISGLEAFAEKYDLAGSHFTAIGAFSSVVLRFFDRRKMEYKDIPVNEQVEALALMGNITLKADGQHHKIHAHTVVGRADGTTRGGHLGQAHVWPTLEVIVTESDGYLQRQTDEETGLALIRIGEGEQALIL